jgi:nucleotide-binding universal stress UspA family protein
MFRVKRLLVPCDFSRFSDAAIKRASDIALASKAELHLLHIVAEPSLLGRSDSVADLQRYAHEKMEQQLAPHVVVELHVLKAVAVGTPHREICRYAQHNDIDLIVMGTHGRTGLAHMTIGSVAQKVVATAPCQVLVVHHPDQEDDLVQKAAKLLRDEFGTTFGGEFGETRATLKGRLMRMLNTSEQAAEFVVEKLRAEDILVWDEPLAKDASQPHSGTWRIGPFAAVDDPGAAVFEPKDDSPAIDLVTRAAVLRGTDIHIDVVGRGYTVRFRTPP